MPLAQAERQRQATRPGLAVRGAFSPARSRGLAVVARSARTFGLANKFVSQFPTWSIAMPSWSAVPKSVQSRFSPPPERAHFQSDEEYEEARGYWQGHVGRNVAFAMQAHREVPRCLVYRVVPHNGGIVFAEPERAEYIARIHEAFRTAKTWEDLRRELPPEVYSEILIAANGRSELLPVCDEFIFEPECIPGWSDGEYPAWLQQEMQDVLPKQILSTYGKQVSTSVNGTYWNIPEAERENVVGSLTELGFKLEYLPDLAFH